MLVTTAKLQSYILVIMATDGDSRLPPKLTTVSWLSSDEWWTDITLLAKLKRHYQLSDGDFTFIDKHSLSDDNAAQALLKKAVIQIDEYAQGFRQDFDLALDMSIGTLFQQRVWQELQDIPFGETISYATLARRINNPKGYRAVARANGKNPFSLIVPCHRVISSDGTLGGYTGGVDKKEYLLSTEGVKCRR